MTGFTAPGLQLLGTVRWHAATGEQVAFPAERRQQLLALLACHEGPVPRHQLAEWLWPDHEPADARRNLRKVVLQARRLCADLPQAPPLELRGDQLHWPAATDLHDFLAACRTLDHARAVQVYRPGLLAGLEAGLGDAALEWLARQQAWLDERWHSAARHWLDALRHSPRAQAEAAEAILARDPLEEAALRTLLQTCAALNEPTRGLRALHAYGERLRSELGASPAPEFTTLGQILSAATAALIMPRMRGISTDAVRSIIEAAMDTVADIRHWDALLQRLTQSTHALGAMLAGCSFAHPQDGLLLTHGLDSTLGQHYLKHHQDNPRSRAMIPVPIGQAIDPVLAIDSSTLQRTPFYQEILRPQGIRHAASIALPMDSPFVCGGVSIEFCGPHAREQAAQANRLLEHLAPYLQRAAAALLRRRSLPGAETLAAGLNLLPGAVLILAASGSVLFANASAEKLLSAADGLCLREGRLAAARPADARRLDSLLAQAANAPRPLTTLRPDLRLSRRNGQPALRVSVLPMRDGQGRLQLPERAALLVLAEEAR